MKYRSCQLCGKNLRKDTHEAAIYCGQVCFSQTSVIPVDWNKNQCYVYLWYAPDDPREPIYVGKGIRYEAWYDGFLKTPGPMRIRTALFSHHNTVEIVSYNLRDPEAWAVRYAFIERLSKLSKFSSGFKDSHFKEEQLAKYQPLIRNQISIWEKKREARMPELSGSNADCGVQEQA
jgi:hypothetical protein